MWGIVAGGGKHLGGTCGGAVGAAPWKTMELPPENHGHPKRIHRQEENFRAQCLLSASWCCQAKRELI